MRYALLASLLMGSGEETTVWVFFSPDSPDASRIFAELKGDPLGDARGVRVRAVLLVERYFGEREPSEAFLATLRVSGEVRVVDEEGLREATRLKIKELPAVAVTRGRRSHVASGSRLGLKEILKCAR